MTEEFGALLRKCRDSAKLSGKQLIKKLRNAGYERYGRSDISKWEHGRLPPEDVVEELEEILSTPKGLLLRVAGYYSAAEYKRVLAGEELEEFDTEKESSLQRQQMEHISSLQQLARSAIESYPTFFNTGHITIATYDINDAWYDFLKNLYNLFQKLINDAYWTSLAAHLGGESEKIKHMPNRINIECTRIPREELSLHSNELEAIVNEASNLLSGGLAVVAWFGDTKEWEHRGLKPTCPFCPIKTSQAQT